MRFSPDANVLIALVVREVHSETVETFWRSLTQEDELIGSQLLLAECTSTIREKVVDGLLTPTEAAVLLDQIVQLPIRVSLAPEQFTRALAIAAATGRRKAYDMQYVAVAERENCEVLTLDGGVYQAAIENKVRARLLR